jgi:hypothetical protein
MMLSRLRNPLLALMAILHLLTFLTAPATAGMVGALASNPDGGKIKGEDLSRIQRALETQIVKSQLESYGLTAEETRERLRGLSDEQIHLLAQASDRVLAGGDGGGVVVAILIIILLVLLILYVQNKKIVVK